MAETIIAINYPAVPVTWTKIFTGTAAHKYTLQVVAANAGLGTPASTNISVCLSANGSTSGNCYTTGRLAYLLGANTPGPVGAAIETSGRVLDGTQEIWAISSSVTNGGIDLHI